MTKLRERPFTLAEMRAFRREVLAHWKRLAAVKSYADLLSEGAGGRSCAFCQMSKKFSSMGPLVVCECCPVMRLTGRSGCVRTPYRAVTERLATLRSISYTSARSNELAALAGFRNAADRMLAFLERITDEHLKLAIERQKKLLARRAKAR